MFREERHQLIITELQRSGSASVAELARRLRVSEVTIRNDLHVLSEQSWIVRTHGGAMMSQTVSSSVAWDTRAGENAAEKDAIGKLAATLVQPGETVFLDYGTSVHRMAAHLGDVERLTCITLDPYVAAMASRSPVVSVILTGGYTRGDLQLWGPVALHTIQQYAPADRAFIGVSGISVEKGLTTGFPPGVATKQALLRSAREVVVLADTSKLTGFAPYWFADVSAVHKIVTVKSAPESALQRLRDAGIEVLLA